MAEQIKPSAIALLPPSDGRSGAYPETRVRVELITDLEERQKKRGSWVGAHLEAELFWPSEPHCVLFEEDELLILPASEDLLPAIFIRNPNLTMEQARAKILRFVSSWSWNEERGATVLSWTGGSHPHRSKRYEPRTRTTHFDFLAENLPKTTALALAFFREGLSLDHVAYSFLSFYKVIELMHKGQSAQKKWIKEAIPLLNDEEAKKRLAQLGPLLAGSSIQDYIYGSCRCAVAHASVRVVVDPDDPEDEQRLRRDRPIIEVGCCRFHGHRVKVF